MYNLRPNIVLQNALSTELGSMISSSEIVKNELDEIFKEYTEIAEKELFVDNPDYCDKLEDLQTQFLSKRIEYIKQIEILKVILHNAIFLN